MAAGAHSVCLFLCQNNSKAIIGKLMQQQFQRIYTKDIQYIPEIDEDLAIILLAFVE